MLLAIFGMGIINGGALTIADVHSWCVSMVVQVYLWWLSVVVSAYKRAHAMAISIHFYATVHPNISESHPHPLSSSFFTSQSALNPIEI